jgi:SAM-dependent methyltransferase
VPSAVPGSEFPTRDKHVQTLLSACEHYPRSDRPLFVAGYNELCRVDLNGGKILEVCCGYGELACRLGEVFSGAEVIAMDRYPDAGKAIVEAHEKQRLENVRYECGDVLRLDSIADGSLDLVLGQATLHHLAHDTEAVGREFSRVLKPGGRLIFIFEPLGHNRLWAMIRAYRIATAAMPDESNVVIGQLEQIAQSFSRYEMQLFNVLGYPFKSLGRIAGDSMMDLVCRLDAAMIRRWPRTGRWAANFNVVFTR